MIDFIETIIKKFGPRPAGSQAETQAQQYVAEQCRTFTDKVHILEFEEYLQARFGKLKYFSLLFFISLVLYFVDAKVALVISLVNALIFVLEFMTYRTVIPHFPGSKSISRNVEAVLEPQGEVKSTLLFTGHIDSVYEFKWWYHLGQNGMYLTIIAGILIVLLPLFYALVLLLEPAHNLFYVWAAFLFLSPSLVAYFNMHGNNPVDGACDNLSGVSISLHVLKHFADTGTKGKSILKNTRLKFVSFGSEETGLTGSAHYVKQRLAELKKENAHLINIDSVRLPDEICIVKKELMNGVNFDANLIAKLKTSFAAVAIPIKTGTTPVGGTDGVPFIRAGIPAVSIIGLPMGKLDPTYHTRRDVIENLNPLALEYTKKGLIELVRSWDNA